MIKGFKVWDKQNNKWADAIKFYLDNNGILCIKKSGFVIDESKYKLVLATDLTDAWVEDTKKDDIKSIYEGDYVYLHNWGTNNENQMIGVAEVVWDEEYHQWDFKMIAGCYIDSEYDRWRQCPEVVGNSYENPNFEHSQDWNEFIKKEKIQAEINYKKRIIKENEKKLKKKVSLMQTEIDEKQKEIDNAKNEIKNLKVDK